MSIGTIIYYMLWPIVAVALFVYWIFAGVTFLFNIAVEYVLGLHEDIKGW